MKIANIEYDEHSGCWMIVCPFCEKVLASNIDKQMLPEFVVCSCEKPVFELFERDGDIWIRRNKYPRFIGRVTMGAQSDIEDVEILDGCNNVEELATAMRKAGEFLLGNRK